MKRSLADILIENSKVVKHTDGEIGIPSYDSINTPNNHKSGSKEVSAKGLGDRKTSKLSQVEGPKKREKRSMSEDLGSDGVSTPEAGAITNGGKPKRHTKNRRRIGEDDYGAHKPYLVRDKNRSGPGKAFDDLKKAKRFRVQHQAQSGGNMEILTWNSDRGLYEDLGDNPDSKAHMPFSKAENKDEGQKTPKVAKMGGPAHGGKIGTIGDEKKNPADIGKARKLPKGYAGGEKVDVAKVKESLDDLGEFLGYDFDLQENYPDDFSWSRFDAHYGTGEDEDTYEEMMGEAKEQVTAFLRNDAPSMIADYKKYKVEKADDPEWAEEQIMMIIDSVAETVVETFRHDQYDFDAPIEDFKPAVVEFLRNQGVDQADISAGFESSNYMTEAVIDEDYMKRPSNHTMDGLERMLDYYGYQIMGGGATGGEKNYKNDDGDIVTIAVHMRDPKKINGWEARIGGRKIGGRNPDELFRAIAHKEKQEEPEQKKPGMLRRMGRKLMGREGVGEMSSGGAVGGGSIAAMHVPMGGVRKRTMPEAHGTSPAFSAAQKYLDQSDSISDLKKLMKMIKDDRRITHDEADELQAFVDRKVRKLTRKGVQRSARRMSDVLFGEGDIEEIAPAVATFARGAATGALLTTGGGNEQGKADLFPSNAPREAEVNRGGFGYGDKPSRTFVQYRDRVEEVLRRGKPDEIEALKRTISREDRLQQGYEKQELLAMFNKAPKHVADDIDHIPQTVDAYVARLDPYMQKKYYLTWADAAGDPGPIERAIKNGMTPEEFADWWAEKYGLDSSDDPWMESEGDYDSGPKIDGDEIVSVSGGSDHWSLEKTRKVHDWIKSLSDNHKQHFVINYRNPHSLFNVASRFYRGDKDDLQGVDWYAISKAGIGNWSHGMKVPLNASKMQESGDWKHTIHAALSAYVEDWAQDDGDRLEAALKPALQGKASRADIITLYDALGSYFEDSLSGPDYEEERNQIEAAWNELRKHNMTMAEAELGPALPHVEIEWMDWLKAFRPIDNHIANNGDNKFETYGEELEYVKKVAQEKPNHVWTLMDADGAWVVGDGFHFVNRMGYYITEVPFDSGKTYEVYDEDDRDGTWDHDEEDMEEADSCWDGYRKIGTKKKGGRTVNDCKKIGEGENEPKDKSCASRQKAATKKKYGKWSAYAAGHYTQKVKKNCGGWKAKSKS